jgi:hypothetical protein
MTRTLFPLCLTAALAAQDHVISLGHSAQSGNNAQSHPAARVKDNDLDGFASVPAELKAFLSRCYTTRNYSASEPYPKCFYTDVRYALENGEPAFYFSESEEGRIVRGVDANHDGVLQDTEVTEFYFFGARFAPDSVAVWRDAANNRTIVYVAMDATASGATQRGLWRMIDQNGDGDALDAGEAAPFVQAGMALTVPGTSGPVTIASDDFEYVRVTSAGKVIAYQAGADVPPGTLGNFPPLAGDAFCWFSFTDNNGTAVPAVFLNPTTLNNIPQFPEFQNGTFPSSDMPGNNPLNRCNQLRFVDVVARGGPSGEDVFFVTMKRQTNRGGDANINGVVVSGLVYRAVDTNQNGLIDSGEMAPWCNITNAPVGALQPVSFINQANSLPVLQFSTDIYAVSAAANGSFSLIYDNSALKAIVTMRDADNSGVIDQGEVNMVYYSAQIGGSFTPPFHASFGPFVMGLASLPDGLLPGPFPVGVTAIGDGCAYQSQDLRPVMETWRGVPQVGNSQFVVGAIRTLFGSANFFVADANTAPSPVSLAPLGFAAGCFSYLQNPITVGFVPGDPVGRAFLPLPIPPNGALAGTVLHFQGVTLNTAAVGVLPFFTTNALRVTVQP